MILESLEELFVAPEVERVAREGLSAESVADPVGVGEQQSTEELLVDSEVDLGTFALLGSPEMSSAEFEVEVGKVASVRLLEELVALFGSLVTGLELQAAAPAVAAVRPELQFLPEFLLEATLEVRLAGLVAEPAAVVVAPLHRFVVAGVELVLEVDMGFVEELSGLAWLVVEGIGYTCEDIYFAIPDRLCKEPVWNNTHLIGP